MFGIPSGLDVANESCVQLYPPQDLAMAVPKTIDPTLYWRFQAILGGMQVPGSGIFTLKNGTATSLGGNLSFNGKLITTYLQPIDGKPPHQHDLFRFSTKRFFPKVYHAKASVATLAAGWQGAFFHWVYNVLPRFHLIEKQGFQPNKFYVDTSFAFQRQSLELLGVPEEQCIRADEYAAVQTPDLIIPSITETPTDWACAFLRAKILPKVEKKKPFRLYVSRGDAGRRRVVNEEDVLRVLGKYGFVSKQLSGLSFQEQVQLFCSAEAVIGPHGAGFSHLVFCDPHTPVLEFFSPAYVNPCYWHVCDCVGLNYHYLFGEGERYPDRVESGLDPDIVIDLDKLEKSVQLMGYC